MLYTPHPAAALFPAAMDGATFEALKSDIQANGQISPIIVVGELILDGCNRNRACTELGLVPVTQEWDGRCGSPLAFVISKNLKRRHLTTAQRAMIAARITNSKAGYPFRRKVKSDATGIPMASIDEDIITKRAAAAMLNVSIDSVETARGILRNCSPDDIKAIDDGRSSLLRVHSSIKGKQPLGSKTKPPRATDRSVRHVQNTRLRNRVWKNVRTALLALTSLPLPADAARLAKAMDRQKLIPQKLPGALAWLKEFADVCDGQAKGAAAEQHDETDPGGIAIAAE